MVCFVVFSEAQKKTTFGRLLPPPRRLAGARAAGGLVRELRQRLGLLTGLSPVSHQSLTGLSPVSHSLTHSLTGAIPPEDGIGGAAHNRS